MILSDNDLRDLWRHAGGTFHGPNVEHGDMEEAKLLPFLRSLVEAQSKAQTALEGLKIIYCRGIGTDTTHGLDSCDAFKDWLLAFAKHTLLMGKTQAALAWYKEIAQSANRYMRGKDEYAAGQAMRSLLVELSADNGRRAEGAMG